MISKFFIDRPIFATVISIFIVTAGLISLKILPIEQYPDITPPQILVTASYTGANAETIASTVAAPIEQQINGVENMIYMYSQNSTTGDMVLSVFFDIGSNPDMAQVNVQNRVNMALSQLPEEVQRLGVNVKKQTPNFLMIVALDSEDERYDDIFISNYASLYVVDELLRLNGVSDAHVIGARDYSMRIWLQPDRMAQLKITTSDVIKAIREQNQQFAIGQIGQEPIPKYVQLNLPVTTEGRMSSKEEFEQIIIRADKDGSTVRVKDIGRAELGAFNYSSLGKLNGKSSTLIAVFQQYGANALVVADLVKNRMKELEGNFPKGIKATMPYDITRFVKASIKEVSMTILEAAILVVLVVLIFLQNFRATLIPVLAMIISIIGTFAGMYVLGFSLNTLTLFGIVLAIGIVVDDAIVVVENVERNIRELKLGAKEAAIKAMEEVTGPVIAIVFVLCAVFVPIAFLGGIAGELYKQFAVTITISVAISGIVALTLSPALSAILLKNHQHKESSQMTHRFNSGFEKLTNWYVGLIKCLLNNAKWGMSAFVIILLLILALFYVIPTSFVPDEDQGYLMGLAILPDAASLERTNQLTDQMYEIAKVEPGVEHVVSFSGYSLIDGLNRSNYSSSFIILKDWGQRKSQELKAHSIMQNLGVKFWQLKDALILPFNPPSIHGLGTVGGFEFWIENRKGLTSEELENIALQVVQKAKTRKEFGSLTTNVQANSMQLYIDLDRVKARALGVNIADIFQTLQALMGSVYVNDFTKNGRVFRVMLQAEPFFRQTIADIGEVYVKSSSGDMVALSALLKVRFDKGPAMLQRFNGFPATKINGSVAAGFSSGQAMKAIEEIAEEVLPEGITTSWSGQAYQEKATGGTATMVLLGAIGMVFLILAALYERWSLPLSIILSVPFGILGALTAIWLRGMPNDIYFQVGMVTLIALSAKNAILIVEFAVIKEKQGLSIIEAALEASRLRFRAILMTSLTFIFGVIPLVLSSGAGASSRQSVGTGVLGGMIAATVLALFFVPLFFKVIETIVKKND